MPTSNSSKARVKKLIDKALYYISIFGEETRNNLKMSFKGVKTYKIKAEKQDFAVKTLNLRPKTDFEILTLKQTYVLIKEFKKDLINFEANIKELNAKMTSPIEINNFKAFKLISIIKKPKFKKLDAVFKDIKNILFNPPILDLKKFTIENPEIKQISTEALTKPQILEEIIKVESIIKQRSEIFKTTLPIEKKSVPVLNFSPKELDFFKQKLTERFEVHKNRLKIISVYDKLNMRNIQNLKIDSQTKNLYFNFKPEKEMTKDPSCVYLIIGLNRKSNTSVSTMVTEIEFRNFQNS